MPFVELPNLPQCAEMILLGEKYADILKEPLKKLGLTPVFVPDNPFVDARLCGHADLSVFHAGYNRLILAPFLRKSGFADRLEALGIVCSFAEIEQGAKYPMDAQLNACMVGKNLICRQNITAKDITDYITGRGTNIIFCKQGYVKCSVCVVDEASIITSDCGIGELCRKRGMDVLLITPGFIRLDGFPYGFIGGSTFKLADNRMAFTGVLSRHPDKQRIIDFLEKRGIEPVFLTDKEIFDIGSAIPLTEKE